MFKITNISRGLSFAGLYPGESKKVYNLDAELIKLSNKGLICVQDISKINNKNKTSEKDEVQE